MNTNVKKSVAAGALVIGGIGAATLLPGIVAAADPSSSPAASAATGSGTPTPAATDGHHGHGGGPGGFGADDLSAAATALGMTEADLSTALQGGQTLAQVAQTKNVDVNTLIDAMVAAETTEINAAVKAGTMTQAQADQRLTDLKAHETAEVNGTFRGGHGGGPGNGTSSGTATPAPSGSANG